MTKSVVLTLVCFSLLASANLDSVAAAERITDHVVLITIDGLRRINAAQRIADSAAQPTRNVTASARTKGGLHFQGLRGEHGKPIILAAADKANPPVFRGNDSRFHV